MKKAVVAVILILYWTSCNEGFEPVGDEEFVTQSLQDLVERSIKGGLNTENAADQKVDTVIWIDTIINQKFLTMYSTSADNYDDIIADWGNENQRHHFNFRADTLFDLIGTPFSTQFLWTTQKSICFPRGCGQSCMYGLFFNSEKGKPIFITSQLTFYPNMTFSVFESDNDDLYLTAGDLSIPSLIINSVDTDLKDTILLPAGWKRGTGAVHHIIDEVNISENEIEILQKEKGKIVRQQRHRLEMKPATK